MPEYIYSHHKHQVGMHEQALLMEITRAVVDFALNSSQNEVSWKYQTFKEICFNMVKDIISSIESSKEKLFDKDLSSFAL